MDVAAEVARSEIKEYFKSHRIECPLNAVAELLPRLRIDKRTHRWKSGEDVVAAETLVRSYCFNVDDFVENYLRINLQIEPLNHFDKMAGAPVFGFARPGSRSIAVCERTLAYEPLYRASVLHEVGHVLLHANEKSIIQCYSPRSFKRPAFERDADAFMIAALCPKEILNIAIALAVQFHGIKLSEVLNSADTVKSRWVWRKIIFPYLLNHICVSRELLAIYLQDLKVFNSATKKHHLSYRLETKWTKNICRGTLRLPLREIMRQIEI